MVIYSSDTTKPACVDGAKNANCVREIRALGIRYNAHVLCAFVEWMA